jgi:hypothetical protein
MINFYTPIPNIKVDTERLLVEIFRFWKPQDMVSDQAHSFTTAEKYVDDLNYDFGKYAGTSEFISNDSLLKKYPDGDIDQNLIYWPKILEKSYMKELGDYFASIFQVKHYRTRASYFNTVNHSNNLKITGLHNDPHTPYRVHIALKTNPNIKWKFVDELGEIYSVHQQADGVPVLIETGKTKHQIEIPENSIRIHLWFQYYSDIDQTLLTNILAPGQN